VVKHNTRVDGAGRTPTVRAGVDKEAIQEAVRTILRAIGESPEREGLVATPRRIADMYEELFSGLHEDPMALLGTGFEEKHKEMVIVKDIPFYSLCVPSKQHVDAVGGSKPASDVKVGDWLYTLDRGEVQTTQVIAVSHHPARDLIGVTPEDAAPVFLTPEHPVMTVEGWCDAKELRRGDLVEWVFPRRYAQRRYPVHEGYDLGYLLGAVAADGSIQDGRRISVCVKDRAFAEKTAAAFERAFGRPARVEPVQVPSGFLERTIQMFRVRVVSSYIAGLMLKWLQCSRQKKETKGFHLPRGVFQSLDSAQGFLDGYIDGDGCDARSRGRVWGRQIISSNLQFLDELGEFVGSRPREASPGIGTLYVSNRWDRAGWHGRRGFVPTSEKYDLRDSQSVPVIDVACLRAKGRKPYTVYTFTCAPHPTFCVSGLLTHNCEHHLMPFHGLAHVAYIPQGRIVGISKIARVVEMLARRPQVQERLTSQIADLLMEGIRARGAAVVIDAVHLCMTMRGVKKPGSRVVTSATRGIFRENPSTRAEFLSLVKESGA
jgi:GTP cyclohydrolase I